MTFPVFCRAGKLSKPLHPYQADVKSVAEETLIRGNTVIEEQPSQVFLKFEQLLVLISGKLVASPALAMLSRFAQLAHVPERVVADEVLIKGNDARFEQLPHAEERFVAADVFICGNDVRLEHPSHAELKLVTF